MKKQKISTMNKRQFKWYLCKIHAGRLIDRIRIRWILFLRQSNPVLGRCLTCGRRVWNWQSYAWDVRAVDDEGAFDFVHVHEKCFGATPHAVNLDETAT